MAVAFRGVKVGSSERQRETRRRKGEKNSRNTRIRDASTANTTQINTYP